MLKPYKKAELTFELGREIGHDGKNSKVFLAQDHQLNAEIVIKQIEKIKLASVDEFFSESQALYTSAHSNVVQIHYACFDAENIYIAMPYYSQGSVKPLITGQNLTLREIISMVSQMLSGLHNIHSKNLIHFDIKPDNVLLSQRGEAILSDFGQAKQMNLSGIAAQDRLYNPMVPPEVYATDHFDRTFDIYQVGLLLYRMCNGDEVFYEQLAAFGTGATFDFKAFKFALRTAKFPDRSIFPPHIPQKMRTVIKKCLETNSANRYKSAIDVANALSTIDGTLLDWRLVAHADRKVWSKEDETRKYILSVYNDGRSTLTRSVNGAEPRRIGDGCLANTTSRDISRVLGGY